MRAQGAPQQAQIAQQVQNLMPHRLVVEAQCGFERAGAFDDHRVLIVGALAQPRRAHRLSVLLEDERARGRDLRGVESLRSAPPRSCPAPAAGRGNRACR